MWCHPKPIDFHSIIFQDFQDGEIAPPTSINMYIHVLAYTCTVPDMMIPDTAGMEVLSPADGWRSPGWRARKCIATFGLFVT